MRRFKTTSNEVLWPDHAECAKTAANSFTSTRFCNAASYAEASTVALNDRMMGLQPNLHMTRAHVKGCSAWKCFIASKIADSSIVIKKKGDPGRWGEIRSP